MPSSGGLRAVGLAGSLRLASSGVGGPAFAVGGAVESVAFVPEPSTMLLLASGIALLHAARGPLRARASRCRRG